MTLATLGPLFFFPRDSICKPSSLASLISFLTALAFITRSLPSSIAAAAAALFRCIVVDRIKRPNAPPPPTAIKDRMYTQRPIIGTSPLTHSSSSSPSIEMTVSSSPIVNLVNNMTSPAGPLTLQLRISLGVPSFRMSPTATDSRKYPSNSTSSYHFSAAIPSWIFSVAGIIPIVTKPLSSFNLGSPRVVGASGLPLPPIAGSAQSLTLTRVGGSPGMISVCTITTVVTALSKSNASKGLPAPCK